MTSATGRTTLSGEGLQHQDGSSHLAAAAIPNCRAWDPCFGYELATIVEDGARRMLEAQEDVFYYLTVANENYAHPPLPEGAKEGILKGLYLFERRANARLQLLASGPILREALAAAQRLEREHGVAANVWSVTSWSELRWDGLASRPSPAVGEIRSRVEKPWMTRCLEGTEGPIVAASDYVSAIADLPRAFALIDPKQPTDQYPDKGLAGVGLAYKVAQGLIRPMTPKPPINGGHVLDLVALTKALEQRWGVSAAAPVAVAAAPAAAGPAVDV